MDLVKLYDSDGENDKDSDIEEVTMTSKPSSPKPSPSVEVIELSDSDDDSVGKQSTIAGNLENLDEIGTNSCKEIDCIRLDEDTPQNIDSTAVENLDVSSTSGKKIDYLHLDDSGSDFEPDNTEENMVTNLLESASILQDKSCGPQKPAASEVPDICLPETTYNKELHNNPLPQILPAKELHNVDDVPMSEISLDRQPHAFTSESNYSSTRATPDSVQNNASRDSFENSLLESNSNQTVRKESTAINNTQDSRVLVDENLSCIFRDDNSVIEACNKSNISCHIPRSTIQTHNAHSKMITSLSWCIPKYSYLYLSASHDGFIKIWDLYRQNSVQCIVPKGNTALNANPKNTALNAAKWSLDGGQIIAGGLSNKAYVFDVQTGNQLVEYDIYNTVTCMEVHPYTEDVFLVGTRNAILGFDIRVNTTYPIRAFFSQCEEVLDIAFLDENDFICSTNIVSHDSADRTIMAWDFASGATLSNQIYLERYTCPSLKVNVSDSTFIAQTNGNYIAAFSTSRPYKMKDKRYMGHKVSGHSIECDISPDGKYIVSGDEGGSIYFYNYSTTNTVLITDPFQCAVNKVKWHPVFSSTVISATYDGVIRVWK